MRQNRGPFLNDAPEGEKVEIKGAGPVLSLPPPPEGRFDRVKASKEFRRAGPSSQGRHSIDERRVGGVGPGREPIQPRSPLQPKMGVERAEGEFNHILRRSAAERET